MSYFCTGIEFLAIILLLFFCIKQNDRIYNLTKKLKKLDKMIKDMGKKKPTLDDVSNDINEIYKKVQAVKDHTDKNK